MKKQAKDELEELEEVRVLTRKKLLAEAIRKVMKAQTVRSAEMARRMKTSRPTVSRLLNPAEPSAPLDALESASLALGLDLQIRLVPNARQRRGRSLAKKPE